jgi:hypothetical protein
MFTVASSEHLMGEIQESGLETTLRQSILADVPTIAYPRLGIDSRSLGERAVKILQEVDVAQQMKRTEGYAFVASADLSRPGGVHYDWEGGGGGSVLLGAMLRHASGYTECNALVSVPLDDMKSPVVVPVPQNVRDVHLLKLDRKECGPVAVAAWGGTVALVEFGKTGHERLSERWELHENQRGLGIREVTPHPEHLPLIAFGGFDRKVTIAPLGGKRDPHDPYTSFDAHSVVSSIRWRPESESCVSWTTDGGQFSQADIREPRHMAASLWKGRAATFSHGYCSEFHAIIGGGNDAVVDIVDLRKIGRDTKPLIASFHDPLLTAVCDVAQVCGSKAGGSSALFPCHSVFVGLGGFTCWEISANSENALHKFRGGCPTVKNAAYREPALCEGKVFIGQHQEPMFCFTEAASSSVRFAAI